MKRALLAIVSTVASLVLLLSFKTHALTAAATPPAAVSSNSTSGTSSSGGTSANSGTTNTKSQSAAKTVTGTAANTRYGPVQVQITVKNGVITAANAVQYPASDPRDAQINSYAIPVLNQEAVKAGSASIDMVSGATYTSEGYLQSLQSALNQV